MARGARVVEARLVVVNMQYAPGRFQAVMDGHISKGGQALAENRFNMVSRVSTDGHVPREGEVARDGDVQEGGPYTRTDYTSTEAGVKASRIVRDRRQSQSVGMDRPSMES